MKGEKEKNPNAVALGKMGKGKTSALKAETSRANGRKHVSKKTVEART